MRLLILGDLAATGFGTVTMDLGRRLLDRGVDARFLSQNDLPQLPEPFLSRTIAAQSLRTANADPKAIERIVDGQALLPLANGKPAFGWKPDACLIIGDFASVRIFVGGNLEALSKLPTFHYCPVEGHDLPPAWKGLWEHIRPVAMSRFGQDQIAAVVGYRPPMIYHGVDSSEFFPVSERPVVIPIPDGGEPLSLANKAACKVAWMAFFDVSRMPSVWILRTDRHMPRKGYPAFLRAVLPVLRNRPEAALVIHCSAHDEGGYLPDSISKAPDIVLDGDPDARQGAFVFRFANRSVPQLFLTNANSLSRPALVGLYNAADIYAQNSAEGFGLTVAEALACGVPVVGIEYSAVPEVIGPAGITVRKAQSLDNPYDHFWAAVNEQQFSYQLERLVRSPDRRQELGALGPPHVRAHFSWDAAAQQFHDLISQGVAAWQPSSPPTTSATSSGSLAPLASTATG